MHGQNPTKSSSYASDEAARALTEKKINMSMRMRHAKDDAAARALTEKINMSMRMMIGFLIFAIMCTGYATSDPLLIHDLEQHYSYKFAVFLMAGTIGLYNTFAHTINCCFAGVSLAVLLVDKASPGLFVMPLFSSPPEKVEYMPFITSMPAPKCYPVTLEEIIQLKEKKHWKETVNSMIYHMESKELDGISSFHVGSGYCFMIMKQEDGSLLQMFNPVFRGYSAHGNVRGTEMSMSCPGTPRVIERAPAVIVLYNDAQSGSPIIRQFLEQQAHDAQVMIMYLLGKTICTMHNADSDNGLATLKEMIAQI